jgi:hypothetical protein
VDDERWKQADATTESRVRLVYATEGCAVQTTLSEGKKHTLLTGTDSKQSVVAGDDNGKANSCTYPSQEEEATPDPANNIVDQ